MTAKIFVRLSLLLPTIAIAMIAPSISYSQEIEYSPVTSDALRQSAEGSAIGFKILVDAANLGSEETRIAELTFPAGYSGQSHLHDAIEIFYVLSGQFGHEVNGEPGTLSTGDIGIVKPGDSVAHSVIGDEAAVVLTIWLPGGAAAPFHQ